MEYNLANQSIDDKKLIEIMANLNPHIERLDLSDNNLTDQSATYLAKFLNTNTSIKHLNLFGNHITNKGAEELLEAIKGNIHLEQLSLGKFNQPDLLDGKLCGEIKLFLGENRKLASLG